MDKKESERPSKKRSSSKKKRVKKLVLILAVIVGVFVTAIITAYQKTRQEARKVNMVRDEMERLYSEGDYEGLSEYYYEQKPDAADAKYAKYKSVTDIYNEYFIVMTYMEESYEKLTDEYEGNEDIRWDLEQMFRVILLCDICREDGFPHDEEKGVSDIRKMLTDYMTEKLLITSEEIESVAEKNLKAISLEDTEKVNEVIDELAIDAMSRVGN
ncbi:MAG: hypothetical protein IJ065_09975 [Eubacterium sp.]|nr:hypothetical protein [Eubacterium sp.]